MTNPLQTNATNTAPTGSPQEAPTDAGIAGHTLILTTNGLRYLHEHWGVANGDIGDIGSGKSTQNPWRYISNRPGVVDRFADVTPDLYTPYETTVAARNGLAQTSQVYFGGRRATIQARTSLGFEIEGTPNHRIWARTHTGEDWVRLDALRTGQPVAVRFGDDLWRETSYRGNPDRDKFYGRYPGYQLKYEGGKSRLFLAHGHHLGAIVFPKGRHRIVEVLYDTLELHLELHATKDANGLLTLAGKHRAVFHALQLSLLNLGVLTRFVWGGVSGTLSLPIETLDFLQATATQDATPNPRTHWDKIVSLEPSSAEVFDLVVPGEESCVGNGFINNALSAPRNLPHSPSGTPAPDTV